MPERLVQREAELEAIERLLQAAGRGSGGAVVVEGPPGIGRTSLLRAAVSRARALGMDARLARADDFERRFPFAVAHQLFEPSLRALPAGAAEGLVNGETPLRAAIVGLYALAARLSERTPLLLAVDDADCADEASLDWLRFMLPRLDELPLAVAVAARPPVAAGGAALGVLDVSRATLLAPAPLDEAGTGVLLRQATGRRPDAVFARACHGATGGNPALLREVARALRSDGSAPTRRNAAAVGELCPPSLTRYVGRRLARLRPEERELAEALAVLGADATVARAGAVAGLARADATAAADRLRAAGVLGAGTAFAQPLLESAVRAGLPAGRREALRLEAARVLDRHGAPPERVAEQLCRTEPGGRRWVSRALRAAAAAALARGDVGGAVRFLRRALAEGERGERGTVLRELGLAESRLRDEAAVEHLREAHGRATGTAERVAVALALARALLAEGRVAESTDVLDAAARETRGRDEDLAARCEAELCALARFQPPHAERTSARLAELAAGPLDPPGRRALLACVAAETALTGGPTPEAAVLAERALASGRLVRESTCDSPALHLACLTLTWCDRPAASRAHLDDALDDARSHGSVGGVDVVRACRAHAELRAGDVRRAEADARAALEAEPLRPTLAAQLAAGVLTLALLEQDRVGEAEAAATAAVSSESQPVLGAAATLLHARGRLRLRQGDAEAARTDLEAAGDVLEACGVVSPALIPWRSGAALAHAALGDRERARELVREELVLARRSAAPRAVAVALRGCARLAPPGEAIALLAEAVALLEDSEARLEHASALCDLGASLRRGRRRRDAREPLRRAVEIGRALGAAVVANRAWEELALAGARPRRTAYSGRDALTPAEERIAQLAAAGHGNREIAEALVLSLKTVETHLGHVYAKLGIASRRDLRDAMGAAGKLRVGP